MISRMQEHKLQACKHCPSAQNPRLTGHNAAELPRGLFAPGTRINVLFAHLSPREGENPSTQQPQCNLKRSLSQPGFWYHLQNRLKRVKVAPFLRQAAGFISPKWSILHCQDKTEFKEADGAGEQVQSSGHLQLWGFLLKVHKHNCHFLLCTTMKCLLRGQSVKTQTNF